MKVSIVTTAWALVWGWLCVGVCQCMFFAAPRSYTGSLTPRAPRVCNGQDVTFRCQLRDKVLPESEIYFAMKVPPNEYDIVNDRDIVRVDSNSADFTLRSIPKVDFINVMCFYGQPNDVSDASLRIGSPVLFPVYTMPVQVQNFRCIVEHYDVMVCEWQYGIEYAMDLKPKVNFQWRISGTTDWQSCPNLGYEGTVCRWERRSDGDTWLNNLDIRISLDQVCEATVTSERSVNPLLLVKPKPVFNLKGTAINSRCVQLQWNIPSVSIPDTNHDYRIQKTSEWGTTYEVIQGYIQDQSVIDETFATKLCNLEEDTKYTLTVTQKPRNEGFWSEGVTMDITMLKDVPSTSPTLLDGAYYWDPEECSDGGKTRNVCLLWRDIKKIDENGDMRGIDVIFTQLGRNTPEVHKAVSEDTTYACARVLCNGTYIVTVNARNEIGTSRMASTILVQRWQQASKQPSFTVEMVTGNPIDVRPSSVFVAFDPAPEETTELYVMWCEKYKGKCMNDGPVNWVRVSRNETNAEILSESPEKYLYSVSMVTNGVSYGSQWEHCIYTKNVAPTMSPQNVMVTTGPDDNTLVVTWEKLGCKSGEPLVVAYSVYYCLISSGKCFNKEVSSVTSRLVLEDLVEDEEYAVLIEGVASQNLHGPESPVVKGIPENNSLKLHHIIGITCGALACITLASIGCVFTVRLFRKRTINWKQKVGGVKLPEAIISEVVIDAPKTLPKLDVRRLSTDSGVPPTPSPTILDDCSIEWTSQDSGNDHSSA